MQRKLYCTSVIISEVIMNTVWYGDRVGNVVEEDCSIFFLFQVCISKGYGQ